MHDVIFRRDGHVATLTLNRSDALNALSPTVLESIVAHCEEIASDETARVVVFRGAGRVFSAGADVMAFMSALQSDEAARIADLGRRATEAVASLPQPTIAALHGHCVGGGLVLAAACDLRIAARTTQFRVPELALGIPLAWGGMAHLVRLVGETLAADLVLTCRRFDSEEAKAAGFLTRIVDDDAFDDEVEELASLIASRPAAASRTTKRQLREIRAGSFDATQDGSALLSALNDPETLAAAQEYLATQLNSSQ